MEAQTLTDLLIKAQKGDSQARDILLQNSGGFIMKAASKCCKRSLHWSNDDELSIAMIAFNEAIDSFNASKQTSFYNYARIVIHRRLIDYFRKESRHSALSLDSAPPDTADYSNESINLESKVSWDEYFKEAENRERRSEIIILTTELEKYNLNFDILEKTGPKHQDTRNKMVRAAETIIDNPVLLNYFTNEKKLPVKELAKRTDCSAKTIRRGKNFITAVLIILTHPELFYLKTYINHSSSRKGGVNVEA